MPQDPPVLIIGSGLTGLLIAHGLAQASIPFRIFEREPVDTFRPREWTMGVHWGYPLLEQLLPEALAARIVREASVDATLDYSTPPTNGSRIYDGVTGACAKELVSEGRLVRVSRRKLRGLLVGGCGGEVRVEAGWGLERVEVGGGDGVRAVFANGEVVEGMVVVGCDGPRSVVRRGLFEGREEDAEVRALDGIVHLTATFSYGDAATARRVREDSHPVWSMMIHPDLFTYVCIQDVPDPEKPEDWQFFLFVAWLGEKSGMTADEAFDLAKKKAENVGEPFRTAILSVPEEVKMSFVDVGYWVATPWDSRGGRVTLAGDAAHPMPPYRGQGLNHAIQDAWNFVELMKKVKAGQVEQADAVREYSDEVAKRGAEETELSTKNAYMLLKYHDFKESPYMKHGLSRQ